MAVMKDHVWVALIKWKSKGEPAEGLAGAPVSVLVAETIDELQALVLDWFRTVDLSEDGGPPDGLSDEELIEFIKNRWETYSTLCVVNGTIGDNMEVNAALEALDNPPDARPN